MSLISPIGLMLKVYHKLLDILFPRLCFGCGQAVFQKDALLCGSCFSKIPIYQTLFCAVCHARLPDGKKFCHKDAQYILAAATNYEDPVKKLIWELKYNKKLAALEPLTKIAEIYFDNLVRPTPTPEGRGSDFRLFSRNVGVDLILPIPLHPKKERQRGFNQSALIAKAIAEKLKLPLAENLLIKIKNTLPQMAIQDRKQREENIVGTLLVKNPAEIAGKNILVVDDVTTTGSTFREVASVLKSAGAKKIIAFAIAKVQ